MKGESILVDTGAWFALADQSDQFHDRAVAVFPSLLKECARLITTNLIVAETYVLMLRSLGHGAAITFLESVKASPRVQRIYSDGPLEEVAERYLRNYEDQDFSFTDAVSFAVMKELGLSHAFSFDRHFAAAGFTLIP